MQSKDIVDAQSGCNDSFSADPVITEKLLDEFDARGVSNELVQFWGAQEAKMFSRIKSAKVVEFLPAGVREMTLRFLADLMGLSQNGLLDAALLLDLYCFCKDASVKMLPATCLAVVTLLKKNGNSAFQIDPLALSKYASQFAQWLHHLGYITYDVVSSDTVFKQEEALLRELGWHINAPSIQKWMSVFCDRFDVLSNRQFTSSLEWIYEKSIFFAVMLAMQGVTAISVPPQRMANGLFGLFLIIAHLLPFDALRPVKVTALEWEELFLENLSQGTLPSYVLPAEAEAGVRQLLHLTTGCELPTLQADAYGVIATMRLVNHRNKHQQPAASGT